MALDFDVKNIGGAKGCLVRFKDANFDFGDGNLVFARPVNLCVPHSAIAYVSGANGTGKTTLGRLILGELKPKQGLVELNGRKPSELRTKERPKIVGYVPQNPYKYFLAGSVQDELNLQTRTISGCRTMENAHEWFDTTTQRLGITIDLTDKPTDLDFLDAWICAVLIAVACRPLVLYIDELPSVRMPIVKDVVHEAFRSLAQVSGTVVVTAHRMPLWSHE